MKELKRQIKERQFARVYLLYGEESYLRNYYSKLLMEAVTQEDTMNSATFSESDIDLAAFRDFVETMPFFADYRFALVREVRHLALTVPGSAMLRLSNTKTNTARFCGRTGRNGTLSVATSTILMERLTRVLTCLRAACRARRSPLRLSSWAKTTKGTSSLRR